MKHVFLFLCLSSVAAISQSYYNLEMNNVRALISDGGNFFEDGGLSIAGYEVPKGSDHTSIYSMGFWMVGTDMSATTHSSYTKYMSVTELAPGPIANDYNSTYFTNNFLTSMWTVSKADIDFHNLNYLNVGYTVPQSILDWPGNGDPAEGVAQILAPYVDVNSNGTYDPVNGDYPFIQGDQATYVILNDENAPDVVAGPPLGVEVHVMFYQISSADAINNTTFYNVKIHNRSANGYLDFKFGIFSDFDLGNYQDDYWGSDSARNYMFVYNGDNDDEDGGGVFGYGPNPPAVGIVSLNENLESALTFSSGSDPSTAVEHYNVMQGLMNNGSPFVHTNGYDTKFQYSDDLGGAFSEDSLGNPPSDRRGLMTVSPGFLSAGNSYCIDYAIVYHRNNSADNIQNAIELDSVVDFVQDYYDNNIQPCNTITVGLENNDPIKLEIYPNPNSGNFAIVANEQIQVELFDMSGKLIYSKLLVSGTNQINLQEPSGVYMLKAYNESVITTEKIIIR